jgi:hypothetical protein
MPISSLSGGTTPEPIQTQPVSKPISKAEARMTSVSAAINAEAPEGVLLGSKKIEPLSSSLLPRTSPEAVNSEARKILTRNQVSGEVSGGPDAVAVARLNSRFNRLLRSTAKPSTAPEGVAQLLPEPDVYASGHVSIIFTPGKATIVGLEGVDPVQFRQNLERTNPDVASRLAAIPKEDVFFVSRKEEQEINQLVDSKIALMATELREGLTQRAPQEEEPLAAEEEQEPQEGVEEEEAKGPESVAGGSQRRTIQETPTSVLAAAVNEVFAQHLLSITQESAAWLRAAAGMMLSNARQREREAAESSKKRQEENREVERADIKEDQKHYDQEQEAIESDQTRSSTQQAAARREKAISSESIALGVSQEKKRAGEPSPPPNPKTSSS